MTVRLPNPMSAVVWLAFLLPAAALGGWADLSLGAAAFVLGAAVLIVQPSPWETRPPSARALRIFLLLEFLYAASALYSAGFNGSSMGPREYLELPRCVLLGAFVVHLIRHFDAGARGAVEGAAAAALYVFLLFPSVDPQGYVAVLSLCWLLFFSRLRLRFLHAATAALVVVFNGGPAAWAAASVVLAAALSARAYRVLVRRRTRRAAGWSLALCAALLAAPLVLIRASPAAAELRASTEPVTRQFIRRSPVFGWGPTRPETIPGRSQYLFWTLKGGLLGAGAILAALLYAAYRLLRSAGGDPLRLAGAAAFLAAVALMLAYGRFFESYRLFFATAFFAAGMHEARR
jgi:hypothetical protein